MGLFKKEKELVPPIAVGKRFKYLGINMVCVRHWDFYLTCSVVVAEYIDRDGDLVCRTFPPCDWTALKAEMRRKK